MHPIGPENAADRALREWFDELERHNLDRLEEGAKTITQLVTGLYGVLFAVLALSDQPAYLKQPIVQGFGIAGVALFFVALLAALVVAYPWRTSYQEDNLSSMRRRTARHAAAQGLGVACGSVGLCRGSRLPGRRHYGGAVGTVDSCDLETA